jgi:hypothetical protein
VFFAPYRGFTGITGKQNSAVSNYNSPKPPSGMTWDTASRSRPPTRGRTAHEAHFLTVFGCQIGAQPEVAVFGDGFGWFWAWLLVGLGRILSC